MIFNFTLRVENGSVEHLLDAIQGMTDNNIEPVKFDNPRTLQIGWLDQNAGVLYTVRVSELKALRIPPPDRYTGFARDLCDFYWDISKPHCYRSFDCGPLFRESNASSTYS